MIVCTETVLIGRKCDPMEERIKQQYDRWLSQPGMPADLADELNSIAGDEDAITDRFYRELEFGTGGLRGVIGTGTNRMNVYNIRKATQGLANYLNASDLPKKVAIGYDSRIKSDVFAKVAAGVFAANGIKVNIWPVLMPVPTVSFATRYLHTSAGVMVTASHNPSKYNGYKVYAAHHAGVPGRHQGVRRQKGRQTAGLCAGSGWPAEIRRAQVPAGRQLLHRGTPLRHRAEAQDLYFN